MTVQLGINPITWTNDDMPELGGDIPLETCLAETREAGYSGTELGGKFPRTAAALGPILARYHLKLVSGWFDGRIFERDVAAEFAAIEPHLTLLRDLGCKVVVYADTSGRRGLSADLAASEAGGRRLARLWPQGDRTGGAHGGVRRAHGVPSPHGHDRRKRDGHRSTDVIDRRGSGSAVRQRPLPVRRWRSRGAARRVISGAWCMCIARTCDATCWIGRSRRT